MKSFQCFHIQMVVVPFWRNTPSAVMLFQWFIFSAKEFREKYYHVLKLTAISSLSNFSFTTSVKLLLRKCFFDIFQDFYFHFAVVWSIALQVEMSRVVTFDYNVGQTGTVFITHFDLEYNLLVRPIRFREVTH